MAIKVKPLAEASKYWVEGAGARASRYESETPPAAPEWEKNSLAAAATYKLAVSAANIDRLYAGGIRRAGAAKFARKVRDVGAPRFRPGVEAARADYEAGIAPYLEELAKIDLPPKRPRGDPANIARVDKIRDVLYKKRLALRGA